MLQRFLPLFICALFYCGAPSAHAAYQETSQTDFLNLCATISTANDLRTAIKYGANVNARDLNGRTALMTIVSRGLPELVTILLDEGADINAQDHNGASALMYAAGYNSPGAAKVIKILLARGAALNAQDADGKTALLYAAKSGTVGTVRALLKAGANANSHDDLDQSALILAARYNSRETVRALLSAGAEVNMVNKLDWTPLMFAAANGDPKLVAALLDAGADPAYKNSAGQTALGLAAMAQKEAASKIEQEKATIRAAETADNNSGRNAPESEEEMSNLPGYLPPSYYNKINAETQNRADDASKTVSLLSAAQGGAKKANVAAAPKKKYVSRQAQGPAPAVTRKRNSYRQDMLETGPALSSKSGGREMMLNLAHENDVFAKLPYSPKAYLTSSKIKTGFQPTL